MGFTGSLGLAPLGNIEPGQLAAAPLVFTVAVSVGWTGAPAVAQVRLVPGTVTTVFAAAASSAATKTIAGTVATGFTTAASSASLKNSEKAAEVVVGWNATSWANKNRNIVASITTGLVASSAPGELSARHVAVGAAASWTVSTSERVAEVAPVSWGASSQWRATSLVHVPGAVYGVAPATVFLTASVHSALFPPHVSWAAAFGVTDAYFASVIGAKPVTVQAGWKSKATVSQHTLAVYRETVTGGFEVRSLVSDTIVAPRTASTAVQFQAAPAAVRDLHRTAPAGATFGTVIGTTNLKHVLSTGSVLWSAGMHATVGGQEIDAGSVLFRSAARATVWLPWRQDSLLLPPAGNLPHST